MRIKDIDLDLVAFTPERQNVWIHRLCLALSVGYAKRPMFPWDVSEPASEVLAFHLVAQDCVFPCVDLPAELARVVYEQVIAPHGCFLADLDQFRGMNLLRSRLGSLPANPRILLAAA